MTITPTLASYTGFEEDLPPPFFGAEPNGLEDAIQAANDESESYLVKFIVFWPLEHEAERLSMKTDKTGVQVM